MEMLLHSVYWVEIPVADFERAQKFYNAIYDFEMPTMPMGPGGKNKMGILLHDQQKGGVGAAIVWGEGYSPSPLGPKVYLFGGEDLNTVLNRVANAGGKMLMPKTLLSPDMGHIAMFEDTEGNHLLLYSKN
jgi:predicted enzyme related to lactoylglutathione lyase